MPQTWLILRSSPDGPIMWEITQMEPRRFRVTNETNLCRVGEFGSLDKIFEFIVYNLRESILEAIQVS